MRSWMFQCWCSTALGAVMGRGHRGQKRHIFRTLFENFRPRSPQVRSPGQVKCPTSKIAIASRSQWSRECFETFRISATQYSAYNFYISFFYIADLVSGHFRDLPLGTPAAAGPPSHPPAAGGHIFAPIFFLAIYLLRNDKSWKHETWDTHTYLDILWMLC